MLMEVRALSMEGTAIIIAMEHPLTPLMVENLGTTVTVQAFVLSTAVSHTMGVMVLVFAPLMEASPGMIVVEVALVLSMEVIRGTIVMAQVHAPLTVEIVGITLHENAVISIPSNYRIMYCL